MYKVLSYISILSILLPVLCSIIKFKTLNAQLRVLFIYLVVTAINEILSLILPYFSKDTFYISQNVYTILEGSLLILIYLIEFKAKPFKNIVLLLLLIFFVAITVLLIFSGRMNKPESYTICVESLIMIILSIYLFYDLMTDFKVSNLRQYPLFWINWGVLIYFGTSSIVFIFDSYLIQADKKEFQYIWSLHLIGNIIFSTFLAIGVWRKSDLV